MKRPRFSSRNGAFSFLEIAAQFDEAGDALKVGDIEGQDLGDVIGEHRGDDVGVVDLLAYSWNMLEEEDELFGDQGLILGDAAATFEVAQRRKKIFW